MSAEATWTVLKILEWTAGFLKKRGSSSGRLDAELMLSDLLEMERIQLYAQFDRPLLAEELAAFRARVKRRAAGEPVAYILGHQAFWTLELVVDRRVLIPRPDTETLVRVALKKLAGKENPKVVDIGTGSGAIALSIAAERADAQVLATDLSAEALEVARMNAAANGLEGRVRFAVADVFEGLEEAEFPRTMIISNPPYIGERERGDLSRGVVDFEPAEALFSGEEGFDMIRRLIVESPARLEPGGYLLLEIGYAQGEEARRLLEEGGFEAVEIVKDYGGNDRVALGRRAS